MNPSLPPSIAALTPGLIRFRRVLALAAAIACAGFSGCVVTSDHHTTITGHKIADATFAQVAPGQTKDFVAGLLGEPSEKSKQDNGLEQWRWHYTETERSGGGVIVVFATTTSTKTDQTRYVEFKDGVVARAWTE